MGLLLIICVLFIILILKQGYFLTCDKFPVYKHMFLKDVPFKAGDILLFSNSSYKVINRTFGNNLYSHVGIVVEENGKLYSMELTNYKVPGINQEDQIYVDLYYRIAKYSGQIYYKQLDENIFVDKIKLVEISKRKNKFNSLLNNCATFILDSLYEIKIINKKSNKLLFWKNMDEVINLKMYNTPIKIVPENLMINNVRENRTLNYCG